MILWLLLWHCNEKRIQYPAVYCVLYHNIIREGFKKNKIQQVGFWPTWPDPPPHPSPQVGTHNFEICWPIFFILLDTKHFKMDFSMKIFFFFTSFIPLLFTVSKLYYTYYHLSLLIMVYIVLIWFLLNVLQESSNLDAIFIVCRKIKIKLASWFLCQPPPLPLFGQKPTFWFFFNPSIILNMLFGGFCSIKWIKRIFWDKYNFLNFFAYIYKPKLIFVGILTFKTNFKKNTPNNMFGPYLKP